MSERTAKWPRIVANTRPCPYVRVHDTGWSLFSGAGSLPMFGAPSVELSSESSTLLVARGLLPPEQPYRS